MAVEVRPARADELEALLPLIAGYQRFYGVESPDDERNASFFGRFVAPGERGLLLGAFAEGGEPVGFACVYWTFSSVGACEAALMNDLYVSGDARSGGIGRALIDAAAAAAGERGLGSLIWQTHLDNRQAQRLYERTGARRSALFEYELETEG